MHLPGLNTTMQQLMSGRMKHGEDLDSMVRKAIVRSDSSLTVPQHDAESSIGNQLQKL
jgi:hypothetical protein